ncbi:MAG: YcfL family protein [Sedimentisphaerales bacterium]|nr:YcfL family protein [Sedimentisphaerales bacterium]MBN2842850.1 YcfL family protein [Sedimentisphaerales bacterium]
MKIKKILPITIMLAMLAGCGSQIPDKRVTASPGVVTDTPTENVVTRLVTEPLSMLFGDRVDVLNVNKGVNDAGYLRVDVRAHNRGRKVLQFQYRFEWLDVNDFPLDTQSTVWQLASAQGGADFSIAGTSPRKEAVNFRLHLRKNY